MLDKKNIYVIGYASSIGGPDPRAGEGPLVLQKSPYLTALNNAGIHIHWDGLITSAEDTHSPLKSIAEHNQTLANMIENLTSNKKFFMVLGGDHTSAIGTWSGASYAIRDRGPLGLIWIDAHMDAHTPETSGTGNYHGMPLACLLGFGEPSLTHIKTNDPKILPKNLCLIGIRSFEKEEKEFLDRLNVKIYYIDEVKQRGLPLIMQEAISLVTKETAGFGVSLDIDSIDPTDAPATDVSEPGGLDAKELMHALTFAAKDPRLLGAEVTEFDPHRDIDQKTEKLIPELIKNIVSD